MRLPKLLHVTGEGREGRRFAPSPILLLRMTLQLTTHKATLICPLPPRKSVLWGHDCTCTSPTGQSTIPYPRGRGPPVGTIEVISRESIIFPRVGSNAPWELGADLPKP